MGRTETVTHGLPPLPLAHPTGGDPRPVTLGVIGGSGLYKIEDLSLEAVEVETPFGAPSDLLQRGELEGLPVVFLPRHGVGHRFLPSEVNYRANIWALKRLGVNAILSVSAVGSLREEITPGSLVCVDQFFDRTRSRPSSFFGEGCVAHVPFGDPVEEALRQELLAAAREDAGIPVHDGGTYVCVEGPAFSSRAESLFFRQLDAAVVGMTNLPEARLAREAELPYATLALSTDYDCWRIEEEPVTVEEVMATVAKNLTAAQRSLRALCRRLAALGPVCWRSHGALAQGGAIMTAATQIPPATRARLELLIGSYL